MKRLAVLLLLILILPGCQEGDSTKGAVSLSSGRDQIRVVEGYNKAIFTKDWKRAKTYLGGNAEKALELNVSKYKNSSYLLSQKNTIETQGELFCIVQSEVKLEIQVENGKSVLSKEWVRYYLRKSTNWKIIKAEEMPTQYSNEMLPSQNSKEDEIVKDVVKEFITYSVQGNVDKASVHITGKLYENAQMYSMKNMPKLNHKISDILVLGGNDNEKIVQADYKVNNKDLQAVFHLLKIKDKWLINDQIS